MTCCFTGHRPDKLNGYNPYNNKKLLWQLRSLIVDHIENKGVTTFVTGMALGIDQWAARIVLKLRETDYPHIKLIAAIPCKDHPNKWGKNSQEEWQEIIDKCNKVFYVSKEPYTSYCMNKRNEFMVNSSHYVIAVWDESPGGTGNCVKYAKKKEREITYLNPKDFK